MTVASLLLAALLLSAPEQTPADVELAREAGATVNLEVRAVSPVAQTEPVDSDEDAADDPAVWVHPAAPSRSLVLGTDKQKGVAVYRLDGARVQFLSVGRVNNIDVRPGFDLAPGRTVDLAAASQRDRKSVVLLGIDRATGQVSDLGCEFTTGLKEPYGLCMYKSARSGEFFVFVGDKASRLEQWKLTAADGKVTASKAREFSRPTQCEGMVADDAAGVLYLAEEGTGIFAFDAEPTGAAEGRVIATVSEGHLKPDVEGLAILRAADGARVWLLASSQGDATFAGYDVTDPSPRYLGSFRVGPGAGIDATEETDGIEISTAPLGPAFPEGLFIAQDGVREGARQNFKFVPLKPIREALAPTR